MASSLEELLWEEGFKGRQSTERPRNSMSLESKPKPLHPPRRSVSQQGMVKMRTERTRSDVSRYKSELVGASSARETRSRDKFVKTKRLEGGSGSGASESYKRKEFVVEEKRGYGTSEIVQAEEDELNSKFKDIYSNEVFSSGVSDRKELEGYVDGFPIDIKLEKRYSRDYRRSLLGHTGSKNNDQANGSVPIPSDKCSLNSNSFTRKRSEISISGASEPALDQVAIQAVISILVDHIKPFLHDENFRNSLRVNCFSSLNINESDGVYISDNKVISNLEQAIETVERAVIKGEITKDLKKASLQLSLITGLNSNDMKDGFTPEIPNLKLSAWAHVYLSVFYKLQKKDKLSARHILKLFCKSPFQARNLLLPELWDILFFPHLSHIKKWYTDEVDALTHDPSKSRKLRFLEKVYNDILDSGTFQFASYYKDWLTENIEAPNLPLIHIPTISVRGVKENGSSSTSYELTSSPTGTFSPQSMVSRRLYDAVFNNSKHVADEVVHQKENYSPHNYVRSSCRSNFSEKQAVTNVTEKIKYDIQDTKVTTKDSSQQNEDSGNIQDSQAPCLKDNEHILKNLAVSVFKMQKSSDPSQGEDTAHFLQTDSISFLQVGEALEDLEYLDKEPYSANVPRDFMCPLTGRLLSDPVTLETCQTFERAAIAAWLQSGNNTCPVTGKTLECATVPLTNFILKRIVDNWKFGQMKLSKVHRGLEDQPALCMLEQLLTGPGKNPEEYLLQMVLSRRDNSAESK